MTREELELLIQKQALDEIKRRYTDYQLPIHGLLDKNSIYNDHNNIQNYNTNQDLHDAKDAIYHHADFPEFGNSQALEILRNMKLRK